MDEAIQPRFFQAIKERLEPHVSLVDEMADILEVSNDSAYRRLRGETALTIQEVVKLCERFNVSLDAVMNTTNDRIVFNFQPLDEVKFNFHQYLEYIRNNMKMIDSAPEKEVIYMANDIPLFQLLNIPQVASFKLFFWQKTILDFSEFRNKKFKLDTKDQAVNELSSEIRKYYCRIPSTEIYHSETIDPTIKQIEFYHVSGLFESPEEAMILCDKVLELIDHIEHQCSLGFKFVPQEKNAAPTQMNAGTEMNYKVFHNEVIYTDNMILVKLGDRFLSYMTSTGITSLNTESEAYFLQSYRSVEMLKRKSTMISGTSEKERNRVFLNYRLKINELKKRLA